MRTHFRDKKIEGPRGEAHRARLALRSVLTVTVLCLRWDSAPCSRDAQVSKVPSRCQDEGVQGRAECPLQMAPSSVFSHITWAAGPWRLCGCFIGMGRHCRSELLFSLRVGFPLLIIN